MYIYSTYDLNFTACEVSWSNIHSLSYIYIYIFYKRFNAYAHTVSAWESSLFRWFWPTQVVAGAKVGHIWSAQTTWHRSQWSTFQSGRMTRITRMTRMTRITRMTRMTRTSSLVQAERRRTQRHERQQVPARGGDIVCRDCRDCIEVTSCMLTVRIHKWRNAYLDNWVGCLPRRERKQKKRKEKIKIKQKIHIFYSGHTDRRTM